MIRLAASRARTSKRSCASSPEMSAPGAERPAGAGDHHHPDVVVGRRPPRAARPARPAISPLNALSTSGRLKVSQRRRRRARRHVVRQVVGPQATATPASRIAASAASVVSGATPAHRSSSTRVSKPRCSVERGGPDAVVGGDAARRRPGSTSRARSQSARVSPSPLRPSKPEYAAWCSPLRKTASNGCGLEVGVELLALGADHAVHRPGVDVVGLGRTSARPGRRGGPWSRRRGRTSARSAPGRPHGWSSVADVAATWAPPATGSDPPSQKSFCTSTTISARLHGDQQPSDSGRRPVSKTGRDDRLRPWTAAGRPAAARRGPRRAGRGRRRAARGRRPRRRGPAGTSSVAVVAVVARPAVPMPITSASATPSAVRRRSAHLRPPIEILSTLFLATDSQHAVVVLAGDQLVDEPGRRVPAAGDELGADAVAVDRAPRPARRSRTRRGRWSPRSGCWSRRGSRAGRGPRAASAPRSPESSRTAPSSGPGDLDGEPHRLGDVVGVDQQGGADAERVDLGPERVRLGVVQQRERVRAGAGGRDAVALRAPRGWRWSRSRRRTPPARPPPPPPRGCAASPSRCTAGRRRPASSARPPRRSPSRGCRSESSTVSSTTASAKRGLDHEQRGVRRSRPRPRRSPRCRR